METVACHHKKIAAIGWKAAGTSRGRENSQSPIRLARLRTNQGDCSKIIPGPRKEVCAIAHIRRSGYPLNLKIEHRM